MPFILANDVLFSFFKNFNYSMHLWEILCILIFQLLSREIYCLIWLFRFQRKKCAGQKITTSELHLILITGTWCLEPSAPLALAVDGVCWSQTFYSILILCCSFFKLDLMTPITWHRHRTWFFFVCFFSKLRRILN